MNELCLFAGAGGGSIASKWFLGFKTVCYVEIDRYCQEILEARIRDGLLDDAPVWGDVRTFDGKPWCGCVDIVTAGFPCQPFSVAGRRQGEKDERNMWPDTIRIIREVRPRYAFLENVPGLLVSGYFSRILGDLAAGGYDIRWQCLSAAELGAPHKRDRLWIVAFNDGRGCLGKQEIRKSRGKEIPFKCFCQDVADAGCMGDGQVQQKPKPRSAIQADPNASCKNVADAAQIMRNGAGDARPAGRQEFADGDWWSIEPDVGRVANGVAHRVDRLKALGNGQVPQVAAKAWELLND